MAKDKKGNTGTDNTGENNSGNWNSGDGNSGDGNSGYGNSGNRNSGNGNSGYGNSGNRNSGNRNSGNRNSGDGNSGNGNSGNRNSGNRNSGNRNSGNGNSGNGNSGNWNSGDRNSGDGNSGCFNTDEPFARFFNKPTTIKMSEFRGWPDFSEMNPCVWVEESIMTDEEKKEFPTYKTTGGYIKKLEYKQAWAVWKRKCSEENWQKVLALPNFDAQIFEEITGIKVEDNSEAKKKAQELEDEAEKLLAKAKELRSSL